MMHEQKPITQVRRMGTIPYLAEEDSQGTQVVPTLPYRKLTDGTYAPETTADPPVTDPDVPAGQISLLKGLIQQQNETLQRLATIEAKLHDRVAVDATLTGSNVSFVQKPDVVTTDTVITAGSNVIFKDTGDKPWVLGSGQRRVAAGYSLGTNAKSRLVVLFYSAKYPASYPLKDVTLVDNTGTAAASGAGITDALSNRYVLRLFNTDSVDITLKVLTRAEVG